MINVDQWVSFRNSIVTETEKEKFKEHTRQQGDYLPMLGK
jgi:hypothetical protein